MSADLLRAFLEDLAVVEDRARESAVGALRDPTTATWVTDAAALSRLRERLGDDAGVEAFASVVAEFVHVALHSALVTIDGGSASAEVGRVHLVDDAGESLGEGLHELFVDHLFDTGRLV